jgi:hypothetical protein
MHRRRSRINFLGVVSPRTNVLFAIFSMKLHLGETGRDIQTNGLCPLLIYIYIIVFIMWRVVSCPRLATVALGVFPCPRLATNASADSRLRLQLCRPGLSNAAPAGAMAPVIYFPGALLYSAGLNVNQNFKEKYFLITVCFSFFVAFL